MEKSKWKKKPENWTKHNENLNWKLENRERTADWKLGVWGSKALWREIPRHVHWFCCSFYTQFLQDGVLNRCFDTGWQRPIGCLKLQVVFDKKATNYGAFCGKMTYEDEASYDSTPPCNRSQDWQFNHKRVVDTRTCSCILNRVYAITHTLSLTDTLSPLHTLAGNSPRHWHENIYIQ